MATLLIGPVEEPRTVHKSFICYYSPFFEAAFKHPFREAEENAVRLKDTDSDVVDVFIHWLYTQSVATHGPEAILAPAPERDRECVVTDLCIFANRYNIPRLREHAMDEVFDLSVGPYDNLRRNQGLPQLTTILKAFDNLPHASGLSQFWADVWNKGLHSIAGDEKEISDEFNAMVEEAGEYTVAFGEQPVSKTPARNLPMKSLRRKIPMKIWRSPSKEEICQADASTMSTDRSGRRRGAVLTGGCKVSWLQSVGNVVGIKSTSLPSRLHVGRKPCNVRNSRLWDAAVPRFGVREIINSDIDNLSRKSSLRACATPQIMPSTRSIDL